MTTDTPPVAHARRTDPETSHEAARSVEALPKRLADVLLVLTEHGPAHDEDLCQLYRQRMRSAIWSRRVMEQTDQSIRSRRAELVKAGKVEYTGQKALTKTGRKSRVWRAVAS